VLGYRQDIPCSPGCRLLIGPVRRSPAGGVFVSAPFRASDWPVWPRVKSGIGRAASAGGFHGSAGRILAGTFLAGSIALHTSRRINPAAGLRRLLDRRKAAAIAGSALAFGPGNFCPFHFRSQFAASRIQHLIPGPTAASPKDIRANKAAPTALEVPDWGRRRSDRSRRKQSAASLSVPVCDFGSRPALPQSHCVIRHANIGCRRYQPHQECPSKPWCDPPPWD
jgi:hypothetical protein